MGAGTLRDCPVRLGFDRVNKVREFMGVLNKEHRRVVAHQIENPLFGIKLGGETADISHRIPRARSALYR